MKMLNHALIISCCLLFSGCTLLNDINNLFNPKKEVPKEIKDTPNLAKPVVKETPPKEVKDKIDLIQVSSEKEVKNTEVVTRSNFYVVEEKMPETKQKSRYEKPTTKKKQN
ncbi:MAG: hypothetical protein HXX81_06385 [Campylobacterales bacterium]|nr:hypothetical protein [Campylobacterales bacterium]